MIWDMSQVYANSGFLDSVSSDLGAPASGGGSSTIKTTMTTVTTKPTTTATTTTNKTTTTSSSAAATTTAGTVGQYNQCAGEGWTGGTVCQSPYICTEISVWYSQCECPGNAGSC